MLAFTHSLSFRQWDSVKYILASAVFNTHHFLCNVASEKICKRLPVLDEFFNVFVEKGCKRGRDRIREKSVLVSPNFVKNNFIKSSPFS